MKKTIQEEKEAILNMMGQLTPSKSINEQYWDDDRGDAEDFERESLRNDDMVDREDEVYDDMEGLRDDLKPLVGDIPKVIETFIAEIREASPSTKLSMGPVKIYFDTIVDHYFNKHE